MDPKVSTLLLLLLCATLSTAEVPVDCCLKVANQRLPLKIVESYTLQEAWRGCKISATVIIVKGGRGKKLCLPHPEEHSWVKRLLKMVDQKKAKSALEN